ncbi:hypothetical protein ZWY2020_029612 [Hordeum vulgare]|nr:hypothetical protein ZWY2020_029612 [Hordeum vulgare]
MATAAATHAALRVGMKFNPTPRDAIGFYLRRRVLGQPLPDTAGVIHEARFTDQAKDLAAAFLGFPEPMALLLHHVQAAESRARLQDLAHRRRRRLDSNARRWSERRRRDDRLPRDPSLLVQDKSRESDWLMEEYHICGLDQFAVVDGRRASFARSTSCLV